MVDFSRLPVPHAFPVFWENRERLVECVQTNNLLEEEGLFSEYLKNCSLREHPFCKILSLEKIVSYSLAPVAEYTGWERGKNAGEDIANFISYFKSNRMAFEKAYVFPSDL